MKEAISDLSNIDDDYDNYYDETNEDNDILEPLILSMDKSGKPCIKHSDDFIQMEKEDFELMNGFIDKHKKLFDEYVEINKKLNK